MTRYTRAMLCAACSETLSEPADRCPKCEQPTALDGRYRLESVVGSGALGTTYRAVRLEDERVVAIKELSMRRAETLKTIELCEREARVLRQLDHPGIPHYLDDFRTGSGKQSAYYIVQEFIEGRTLAELMETKRFHETEILELTGAIIDILNYLHHRAPPVIHRDIKPGNIMVRPDRPIAEPGAVVLIDFGAVRDAMKDPALGGSTVAGTFGYMAPEQFRGVAVPATDYYALGVLAVAMLSRTSPDKLYDDEHRFQWLPHVSAHRATINFLKSLLEADPQLRAHEAVKTKQHLQRVLALVPRADGAMRPAPSTALTVERFRELAQKQKKESPLERRLVRGAAALAVFGVAAVFFTVLSPVYEAVSRNWKWMAGIDTAKAVNKSKVPIKLDEHQILGVIREHNSDVDGCIQASKESEPGFTAELQVKFTIERNGLTSNIEVTPSSLVRKTIAYCLMYKVKDWRFPQFSGQPAQRTFGVMLK